MRKSILLVLVLATLFATACSEQEMAKNFGGTATIDLPDGKKFVNATWKESNLWYIVREARPGEVAEAYEFLESSNFGMVEGKVVFREHIAKK